MIAGCNAVTITRGLPVYPAKNKMQQDKTITQPYKRGVNARRGASKTRGRTRTTRTTGGTALPGVKAAIKSNRQRGFTVSTIVFPGSFLLLPFSSPFSPLPLPPLPTPSLTRERVADKPGSSSREEPEQPGAARRGVGVST